MSKADQRSGRDPSLTLFSQDDFAAREKRAFAIRRKLIFVHAAKRISDFWSPVDSTGVPKPGPHQHPQETRLPPQYAQDRRVLGTPVLGGDDSGVTGKARRDSAVAAATFK
jgi:hypothetical protein